MFPENKTGKSFFSFLTSRNSTYRNSICSVTAWPFMRSKNCLPFFFFRDASRKFLILLSSYFPVFWLRISSAFAIIFTDCYGLSCMRVWASSYPTLFQVSLGGVRLRCVGLAQKISAHCNTGFYVSPFSLFVFLFSSLHYHSYVFLFPQHVPSDLEVGYEKSILTRTETLLFHYLFQRTPVIYNFISQENVFLFAIYFH